MSDINISHISDGNISSIGKTLLDELILFYNNDSIDNINQILPIISSTSKISLRELDFFVTNYAKSHNVIYNIQSGTKKDQFNVYSSYKNQLHGYKKKYFDPFCRGDRILFQFYSCPIDKLKQDQKIKQIIKNIESKPIQKIEKQQQIQQFMEIINDIKKDISYKERLNDIKNKLSVFTSKQDDIKLLLPEMKCILTTIGQLNFFKWAITNNVITFVEQDQNLKNINTEMTLINKNRKQKKQTETYRKTINLPSKTKLVINATSSIVKNNQKVIIDFNF